MLGWQHRPSLWIGSIYLCLLCPVQRSSFIARVLGANLAGIHLEDGLGTPGKDNEMKGWVAAILTHTSTHISSCLPPRAFQEILQQQQQPPLCNTCKFLSCSFVLLFLERKGATGSIQAAQRSEEAGEFLPNSKLWSNIWVLLQYRNTAFLESPKTRGEILLFSLSLHANVEIRLR